MNNGPIILVEDDLDDKAIFEEAMAELQIKNPLKWFPNGTQAIEYLKTTQEVPFLILSDVNMPGMSGVQFKRKIDADPILRKKSIPFLFFSTVANQETVDEAYEELTVQGYFKKCSDYKGMLEDVRIIMAYWKCCKHPNAL